MEEAIIRKAAPADVPAIVKILATAVDNDFETKRPKLTEDEMLKNFVEPGTVDTARAVALVLANESEVFAFSIIEPYCECEEMRHVANIDVFTAPEYREKGLGKRLAMGSFDLARKLGYVKMFVELLKKNRAARAFYQKMGCRPIGIAIEQVEYHGNLEDIALVERPL